jgi:hypothetical protein
MSKFFKSKVLLTWHEYWRGDVFATNNFANKAWHVVPFLLSVIIPLYFYASLICGHAFNEDYAVYLKEAFNIGHGRPLTEMGIDYYFDPNLSLLMQGVFTYPPLLPLLYALPVAIFGYDIEIIKELGLILLFLALLTFSYAMRRWGFSVLETSASLVLFSLLPQIHYWANSIGSDLPFLLFLIVALMTIEKATREASGTAWRWGIAMGIAIFLATEMRIVGMVLFPTAWLVSLIRHRRIVRCELITAAVAFSSLWGIEHTLIDHGPGYGFILHNTFFTPITNLRAFYWALAGQWRSVSFPMGAEILLIGFVALAVLGVAYEIMRGTTAAVFLLCYTVLLLILPDFGVGARYLIPHMLFFGAFICRGARIVSQIFLGRSLVISKAVTFLTAAVAALLFTLSDRAYPVGLMSIGICTPAARDTFAFIRTNLPTGSRLAASKYRSFHLFTSRQTIRPLTVRTPMELVGWLKQNKVEYIVLKYSSPNSALSFSDCPSSPLCGLGVRTEGLEEIWYNSDFRLFRVCDDCGHE